MPAQQVQAWEKAHRARQADAQFDRRKAEQTAANRRRILKALHDGGVPVIFGTDAPQQFSVPGFSVHREMALMLESGLMPYEVLRTATRNAGEYHKNKARFGTVAAGGRADLILVNGDPLKDLSNVARRAGVMVGGHWLPEDEIQKRLAGIVTSGKP
jgi:imidazolonepropionase-like amidohydrolase